jgi:hypothetical protein
MAGAEQRHGLVPSVAIPSPSDLHHGVAKRCGRRRLPTSCALRRQRLRSPVGRTCLSLSRLLLVCLSVDGYQPWRGRRRVEAWPPGRSSSCSPFLFLPLWPHMVAAPGADLGLDGARIGKDSLLQFGTRGCALSYSKIAKLFVVVRSYVLRQDLV